MFRAARRSLVFALALCAIQSAVAADTAEIPSAPVLAIEGLGKGVAPLDGPWQFHLGDNPAWASPTMADNDRAMWAGNRSVPTSPGARKATRVTPASPGTESISPHSWPRALRRISRCSSARRERLRDLLERRCWWAMTASLPPAPNISIALPAQTFGLGPIRDGVLAIRVWKSTAEFFRSQRDRRLLCPPLVGSPAAIAATKGQAWIIAGCAAGSISSDCSRSQRLVMVLSLSGWLRDRSQRVLLVMAVFSGSSGCVALSGWSARSALFHICPGLAAASFKSL